MRNHNKSDDPEAVSSSSCILL